VCEKVPDTFCCFFRGDRTGYRDPFFWSRLGGNRFDLPDCRSGVLYGAQGLETCVLEVFGDRWLKERVRIERLRRDTGVVAAANDSCASYAIYDTTLAKASLRVLERRRLGEVPELYTILDNYEVALIG
jgi:hypothetical protein